MAWLDYAICIVAISILDSLGQINSAFHTLPGGFSASEPASSSS